MESTGPVGPGPERPPQRGGASWACARWARAEGVDPIGTAGSHQAYLLVEWPLPWPADLAEVPDIAALGPRLQAAGARLQGLVPR
ncbi:MAG: sucrase ferredoxin, partial [Acidimicrobiales bacterium]